MSKNDKSKAKQNKKTTIEKSQAPERTNIMEFPCEFVIKMMGKNNEAFIQKAKAIIHKCFADQISTIEFKEVPSKDNNYLAISTKIIAKSKQELDTCYQALTDEPLVLIAL
jgi:putative lipoic acid-binding regulatory protein